MTHDRPTPASPPIRPRHRTGLPIWAVLGLALLSVPRIFAHDLGIDAGPVPAILTIGPLAVWILVALRARVPSPVLTLLVVGAVYGLALGIVHNLLWDEVFGDDEPVLGELDADLAEVPLRVAAFVSSLFTGIAVGVSCGLVASAIRAVSARVRG